MGWALFVIEYPRISQNKILSECLSKKAQKITPWLTAITIKVEIF
jgi:hypothetical protein